MTKSARLPFFIINSLLLLAFFSPADVSLAATPRVEAGGNHTAAVKADGTLWAWGGNTFGQVGDGSLISRNAPVQIGSDTNWSAVAAGYYHTIALKGDGSLWSWGDNTKGQLGDGQTSSSRSVPTRVGADSNWAAVAAGDFHSLALKTDGSLWAWGDGTSGQVGNGSVIPVNIPSPVRIGADIDWTAIAAGGSHSVALKSNHTLWGWGANNSGQLGNGNDIDAVAPVQIVLPSPFINTDWASIAAGRSHTVAMKQDGTLWSWGSNAFGQLGNGTNLNSNEPVREASGATNWVAVTAGDLHTAARRSDGTIWSWGGNAAGQLGIGTNSINSVVPAKVGVDTNWADVSAGSLHTVALKTDLTVWSWGDNTFGQLGDGTSSPKSSPVLITLNIAPPLTVTQTSSVATPQVTGTPVTFTATGSGGTSQILYQFWLKDTSGVYSLVRPFSTSNSWNWVTTGLPPGTYSIAAQAKSVGSTAPNGFDAENVAGFVLLPAPAAAVNVVTTPNLPTVTFTATASGGTGPYEYQFWKKDTTGVYTLAQPFSASNVLIWDTAGFPAGTYSIAAQAKSAGSSPVNGYDVEKVVSYVIALGVLPASTLDVVTTPSLPLVSFSATAGGGSGTYEYRFWLKDTSGTYTLRQPFSSSSVWNWDTTGLPSGSYFVAVQAKSVGSISVNGFDVENVVSFVIP